MARKLPKNSPQFNLKNLRSFISFRHNTIVLASILVVTVLLIGVVGFYGWNAIKEKSSKEGYNDPTKPTKISYQGKEISVPPRVLTIAPEELDRQIQRKENINIIQIANPSEWRQGHVPGSTYIPKESFSSTPPSTLSREGNLVLVSSDGRDSALIADRLVFSFGFNRNKVYSLDGGLQAWKKAGYKIEK